MKWAGAYSWDAAGLYKGETLRQTGLSDDMYYQSVFRGRFLDRPNRFIARVEMESGVETVHVKNTGRCRELLVPGAVVYLERGTNPARKTRYDLIAVEKGKRLINMDAQAPNKVFSEWAAAGGFLPEVSEIRPEFRYGDSRLDFCLETPQGLQLVEVKGVTLEENGAARFPDAPTERGVKHIRELQRAAAAGLGATLFFVVQMEDIDSVAPNDETHPAFGAALREAAACGVRVCAYTCRVTPDSLTIHREVPVLL
jgi:sugar fermentation stimulation protein A